MSAGVPDTVNALRNALDSLDWPERFERLAKAKKTAPDDGVRDAIVALRAELAVRALTELSPGWGDAPFKDTILRLPKRMRGPLSRAAKDARDRRIAEVMAHGGRPLNGSGSEDRFGVGFDERVVEMPLALAAAALDEPGDVLDAGSALNLPLVRAITGRPRARVTHVTLPGSKEPLLEGNEDRFVHAYGDLRRLPFRDGAFARVVCISTLEHVAMDTTRFGAPLRAGGGASEAVAELVRVMAPGGVLLITVPYGRAADHGWFRVFDRPGLDALLQPAAPAAMTLRFFYYDGGWAEGGDTPPASAVDTSFFEDVITGVAVARVTAH
jgi:SAM-dependent methyltransferase